MTSPLSHPHLEGQSAAPNPKVGSPSQNSPLQSSQLFNGGKFVSIEHRGEIYRLQTTKLGKLILTK